LILSGTVTLLIHFYLLNICTFLFLCVVWYDFRIKMFCSSWLYLFEGSLCFNYVTYILQEHWCQPWFPYQMNLVSLTVAKRMPLAAHELLILSGHLRLLLNLVFCVCGTWYSCTFSALLLSVRLITPVAFSNCLALRWTYDDKRKRGTLKQTTWQRMVENEMMKRKDVKGDWKEDKNKKLWKRLVMALWAWSERVSQYWMNIIPTCVFWSNQIQKSFIKEMRPKPFPWKHLFFGETVIKTCFKELTVKIVFLIGHTTLKF